MLLLTLSFTPPFGSVELGLVVNYSNICVSLPSAVGTFLFVMREKKSSWRVNHTAGWDGLNL